MITAALLVAIAAMEPAIAPPAEPLLATTAAAPPPAKVDRWQLTLGARSSLIRSAAFDPFSTDDGMTQAAVSASAVVIDRGQVAGAIGVEFDGGGNDSTARGQPSHLTLTHWALSLEARYRPRPRVYLFVRAAPGLAHTSASIDDSSFGGPALTGAFTTFALDGAAGGAFRINSPVHSVGFWVIAEGGYGWTPEHRLSLNPPQNDGGPLDLGNFSPRGPFLRIAAALSY